MMWVGLWAMQLEIHDAIAQMWKYCNVIYPSAFASLFSLMIDSLPPLQMYLIHFITVHMSVKIRGHKTQVQQWVCRHYTALCW